METRDFVLLAYDAFRGEIQGKTKLQKTIYFLGVMSGNVDELGYMAHYYGPYSPEVADANAELKSLGFLEESVAGGGAANPQGFEIVRYDYRLTDAGRRIAEQKRKRHADEWKALREKAAIMDKAGDLGYMELSAAAKAYFVLKQHGRKATLKTVREMASRFGWSLGKEELDKAAHFLKTIGLVTLS